MTFFTNKTVVITGGSSGIGLALGKLLAESGADVFSFSISASEDPSAPITFFTVDVTKKRSLQRSFKKLGRKIDILVNNAAIIRRGMIFESSEKDYDDLFRVNLKGPWLTAKLAEPYFTGSPQIIFISSVHGRALPKNPAVYGLTKSAVLSMASIIKASYPSYIVKTVAPGPVDTALSRHGKTRREFREAHAKYPRLPAISVAQKIMRLMESKQTQLVFSWQNNRYSFK